MRALWCGAIVSALLGGEARAADPEPLPAASPDRTQADALFHDGVHAVLAGDLERARRLFEASYALLPRATTLGNLGEVEAKLGSTLAGLHHLKEALAMFDVNDAKRAVAQRAFDSAYTKTGHIAIRTKSGASITIDGAPLDGTAPFKEPVDVMPGRRVLEARAEGQKAQQSVDAPAGAIVDVELVVPDAPAALAPPPIGNGGGMPSSTTGDRPLDPGTEHPVGSPSWWTAPRVVGFALGAGGLVGIGLGTYFHIAAVNSANDANGIRTHQITPNECGVSPVSTTCAQLHSKADAAEEGNAAAKVSWIVAGTAAAGSVIAFVVGTHAPRTRSTGMVVRPIVGPGWMAVEGIF